MSIPTVPIPSQASTGPPPSKRARTENYGLFSETPQAQSPLERLPTEILEMVFMWCLNLSLPRSSSVLGKRLASNHVRTKLFRLVFSSICYSGGSILTYTDYLLSVLDTEKCIGKLQSDILAMSWVNISIINGLEDYNSSNPDSFVEPLNCLLNCRIPVRLLRGPWSEDKCQVLESIFKGGGRLDRSGNTMDEEIAETGLRDAINEGSKRAILALVGSVDMYRYDDHEDVCRACFDTVHDVCENHLHNFCIGLTVGTNHLKLALANDSSYSTLYSLLHGMKIAIDWTDAEITAWAVKKKAAGDKRGQWLLDRICSSNDSRYEDALKACEDKE